jgi:hypothetical protein
MKVELDRVALQTIAGGAADELFQHELQAVLDNMADINTECKVMRKITIELSFLPVEERDACAVTIKVKSKLAPTLPQVTRLFLGQEGAKQVAYEERVIQPALFGDGDQVLPIGRGK